MSRSPVTPNRVWTYLSPPSRFHVPSETIVGAHGTRVTFADGVEAQCGRSGLWNVNFGYGNEAVADAVAEATRGVTYAPLFRTSHPWADRAASDVIDLLGPSKYSHVLFSTSGSAANDAAMKLARQWAALRGEPGRGLIVGLRGSYHGQTYGSLAVSGDDLMQQTYKVDQRLIRHVSPFDVEGLHQLIDRQGSKIAAVVIEPVLGNGTVPVPAEFVEALLARRNEAGYMVIADEVATGFYRTGERFATDAWPSAPDAVILSKALTNGACGAAVIAMGHRLTEPFLRHDATFVHGETQGGSPPSCAAISAVADLSHDPTTSAVANAGARHLGNRLQGLASHPAVAGLVGRGLFRTLNLIDIHNEPIDPEQRHVALECIRQSGSWAYPGPTGIQIVPAVTSTIDELDALVDGIAGGLDQFVLAQEAGRDHMALQN